MPEGWLPTVVEFTITGDGLDIAYSPAAVTEVFSYLYIGGSASAGGTAPATAAPTTAAPPTATPAPTSTPTPEVTKAERTARLIHERINAEREERGLRPLKRRAELDAVAMYHSEGMAENDYFAHTSPDGESVRDRYARFGVACSGGENIFRLTSTFGASPEGVADQAVESWMNSEGHRENILRPQYFVEGLGVVFDGDTVYVTQNFC